MFKPAYKYDCFYIIIILVFALGSYPFYFSPIKPVDLQLLKTGLEYPSYLKQGRKAIGYKYINYGIMENQLQTGNRRSFLIKSSIIAASGLALTGAITACGSKKGGDDDVTTNEDLMREHGVLKRVLLIYDEASSRLVNNKDLDLTLINRSANLIKTFIEDYHEKLEENHLFPRFEKAGQLTDLTQTLRIQHKKGRLLTGRIIANAKKSNPTAAEMQLMVADMQAFVRMYSPHEAREDTVLFPALHKLISKHEYDSLGEDFEKKEKEQFGGDGFNMALDEVTKIEKAMNIYDLNLFTPNV